MQTTKVVLSKMSANAHIKTDEKTVLFLWMDAFDLTVVAQSHQIAKDVTQPALFFSRKLWSPGLSFLQYILQ